MNNRSVALASLAWVAALALFFGFARAPSAAQLSSAAVLQDLHRSNQEALELGRLGQKKGHTLEARRFADIVFYDHRSAERKLTKLAKTEGINLAGVPAANRPLPTGAEFDAAFAEVIIADHQKDIAAVEEAINSTTDKRLQKLLSDQLPMLQRHVDIAHKMLATEKKN